jgi:addiction module RelB/DinJ family antitoxin
MANINIRVDDDLKKQSFAVIERFGMTPSQAFKMFLTQIAHTNTIPLSLDYQNINYEANPTTMQAIEDYRKGRVESCSSLDDFMDGLNEKN